MTEERGQEVLWWFATLPPHILELISNTIGQDETPEDAVAALMVGPCPRCGSEKTRDGDDVGFPIAGHGDTTVGICLKSAYRWCLECWDALEKWPCPHWE